MGGQVLLVIDFFFYGDGAAAAAAQAEPLWSAWMNERFPMAAGESGSRPDKEPSRGLNEGNRRDHQELFQDNSEARLIVIGPIGALVLRRDLDLRLDLHRHSEGELRHSHGGAGMQADLRSEDVEDELGEAVDHGRGLEEARRDVDHAQDP